MRAFSRFLPCLLALWAGGARPQDNLPPMEYRAEPDWPQLPAGWNFRETPGIAADAAGHVYVIHRGDHPIMEFDARGKFVRAFGDGLFERPHAIRIDPEGNIWAVDDMGHLVVKFDRGGRVRMVLGRFKTSSEVKSGLAEPNMLHGSRGIRDNDVPRFNRPTDIAFAPSGDFYVTDGYGNSRIVKFSKDGRVLKIWGQRGSGPGEFHTPHAAAVDRQGNVYVADRENYRIQIFDADGNFQREWTHVGAPWGLDWTREGHLLVADGYNNRVLELAADGKVLGAFGAPGRLPGQFSYLHHLASGPGGSIYTAEILNWRPQKLVRK